MYMIRDTSFNKKKQKKKQWTHSFAVAIHLIAVYRGHRWLKISNGRYKVQSDGSREMRTMPNPLPGIVFSQKYM